MSNIQSEKQTLSRISRYSEKIQQLTPPKDFSEEVLLQVYQLLVENYWKEKNEHQVKHKLLNWRHYDHQSSIYLKKQSTPAMAPRITLTRLAVSRSNLSSSPSGTPIAWALNFQKPTGPFPCHLQRNVSRPSILITLAVAHARRGKVCTWVLFPFTFPLSEHLFDNILFYMGLVGRANLARCHGHGPKDILRIVNDNTASLHRQYYLTR